MEIEGLFIHGGAKFKSQTEKKKKKKKKKTEK